MPRQPVGLTLVGSALFSRAAPFSRAALFSGAALSAAWILSAIWILSALLFACPLALAQAGQTDSPAAESPAAEAPPTEPAAPAGDGPELDAELKQLLAEVRDAFNEGDLDELLSHCHPNVIATWQNGAVAKGHDGVREVVNALTRGEERVMTDYAADPAVEHRLVLHGGDVVVSAGDLNDRYELVRPAGTTVKLNSKWTTTVARIDDRWQIVSFHVSADAFDNEAITLFMTMARYTWAGLGGAVGLVLGLCIGVLLGRRGAGRRADAGEQPRSTP